MLALSVTNRLQALEVSHDRITRNSPEAGALWNALGSQVRETLRQVFEGWASLTSIDACEQRRGSLQRLSLAMLGAFDMSETRRDSLNQSELADLYAGLGSMRGLVEAMADTQKTIDQINGQRLSTPRF